MTNRKIPQTEAEKLSQLSGLDFNIPIEHYQYSMDIIKSFLESFYAENINIVAELTAAYQAEKYKKVAYRLHKLLPVVRMFHYRETAQFIQDLENQIDNTSISDANMDENEFNQAMQLVEQKIAVFFNAAKYI